MADNLFKDLSQVNHRPSPHDIGILIIAVDISPPFHQRDFRDHELITSEISLRLVSPVLPYFAASKHEAVAFSVVGVILMTENILSPGYRNPSRLMRYPAICGFCKDSITFLGPLKYNTGGKNII